MNKCTLVAALTASALAMPATAQAQQAKSGLQGSFTADMYWGSTKIRETRKEDDDIPSFSRLLSTMCHTCQTFAYAIPS